MFNRVNGNQSTTATASNSRRAFRDVTNAGGNRSGNNAGKASKSVVVAKRNNGVKTRSETRSMSIGGNNGSQEVVLQRAGTFGSLHAHEDRNPTASNRDAMSYPRGEINADPDSYQMMGNTDDIDERDAEDPLCATGYVSEMYVLFRENEVASSVRPVYMEGQPHINERMRSILVDWLIEVHLKFKLVPETLYLTINLIDRYLQLKEVSRPKLQLVGVTSLLIASKYEEIYPPELRDLVYICDRAYTRQDIIQMEENVLRTLEYRITIPSAHAFLVRFLKAAHADKKIVQLSCYILDGTLQSYNLLHYLPSQLAAAAVYIARRTIGRNAWSPTLLKYATYCEEEITPIARAILNEKSSASPELRAVNKKYTSHRYGGVATTVLQCDF